MKKEKVQKTNVAKFEPFLVVEHENKHIIVLGNSRISALEFKTQKDAINYIKKKPYELIINAACYCMEQMLKERKETEK